MRDDEFQVTLPWPLKALSPNYRAHWSARSTAARKYREACWALTRKAAEYQAVPIWVHTQSELDLCLTFFPPDRRVRDDDNMVAAFKAGRDGLAQALKIDDKRFRTRHEVAEQIGGYVRVSIRSAAT